MKTYKIRYSKGHLIDVETNKRILLRRGGEFTLLGDNDQFEEYDYLNAPVEKKSSDDKYADLKNKSGVTHLEKICSAGSRLAFRIGIKKRTEEDQHSEFLFVAVLEEDLYLRSSDGEKWTLCECLCYSEECVEGDLQMIEPVYGNSLNNLYSNLVAFYFPLQRSGACNAFDTFHKVGEEVPTLSRIKNSPHTKLKDNRKKIIKEYKKTNLRRDTQSLFSNQGT